MNDSVLCQFMKRRWLPVFLVFFLCFPLCAQAAPEVRATVDRTELRLGESLQLKITVAGAEGEADISPIKDFRVVSRGTSTSINMVNGSFSQEVSYTYTLIPLRQGNLLIPPLRVKTDGGTLQTEPVRIRVSEKAGTGAADKNIDKDIYVQAHVSETSPYAGQQFAYTFKLFRRAEIANAQLRAPDFSSFTVSETEERKQYRTVIRGREFQVTELYYILVPLKAGDFTLGPAVLSCDIVHRSARRRGFFNDPFFGLGSNLEPETLQTRSFNLKVRPLPPYEGAGTFSGLVGDFHIRTTIDPVSLKSGESATLSVIISGRGNIMDAELPEIKVPEGFKIYRDSPEDDVKLSPQGYSGQRAFRAALVPTQPGDFRIPPIRLTYFDTASEKYVSKSAQELTLHIRPSEEKQETDIVSAPLPENVSLKKKVEFTGRDILPLKEDPDALQNENSASLLRFLLFFCSPLLLIFLCRIALILGSKKDEPSRIMARRAGNALKQAEKSQQEAEIFLSHLYRAVIFAILSQSGSRGESLTYAEAADILRSAGYSEENAVQAAALLEKIESAKFSGRLTEKEFCRELLKETRELFTLISV
ncbi:MAG: BatD family protein [Desulfococcaceae bacterium]|jgi:hypothetical protein|nr:BatD family protein [Desulfococcaceae bacterium]